MSPTSCLAALPCVIENVFISAVCGLAGSVGLTVIPLRLVLTRQLLASDQNKYVFSVFKATFSNQVPSLNDFCRSVNLRSLTSFVAVKRPEAIGRQMKGRATMGARPRVCLVREPGSWGRDRTVDLGLMSPSL